LLGQVPLVLSSRKRAIGMHVAARAGRTRCWLQLMPGREVQRDAAEPPAPTIAALRTQLSSKGLDMDGSQERVGIAVPRAARKS
jgi:hypothetical protein